jgi:hypothetical protein
MNCHLPWNLTHQKPSWNWIKLSKEVVDKTLFVQKTSETFCQKYICDNVIVPLHQCLQSKHPWRIWSKLILLYFACSMCIKVFFFKKPKMPKRLLLVPTVGSILWKDQFHQENFKLPFKILNHLGNLFFPLVNHVCPLDVHRYFIICNIWVLIFELILFLNSIILSSAIVPWSDYKF